MLNETIKGKIRKHIKKLRSDHESYSLDQAYNIIKERIKGDEVLTESEMEEINNDIYIRLQENWSYKGK